MIMQISFCGTNKKNCATERNKIFNLEVSDPSTHFFWKILSCKESNIYDVHT